MIYIYEHGSSQMLWKKMSLKSVYSMILCVKNPYVYMFNLKYIKENKSNFFQWLPVMMAVNGTLTFFYIQGWTKESLQL